MEDDDKPKPDPKVKQLLERDLAQPLDEVVDAATAAELEKWFGLPSFQEVKEREAAAAAAAAADPELVETLERQANAIAAVDPEFLAAVLRRIAHYDDRLELRMSIVLHVGRSIALFDPSMADRGFMMGQPHEVEISEELKDALEECSPQALLRDLHRPELAFEKTFEVVDFGQRIDGVAEVSAAMAADLKLPPLDRSPFYQTAHLLDELRNVRKQPWPALFAAQFLPNRRVQE